MKKPNKNGNVAHHEPKVRQRDEARFYTMPDGTEVPSVTTILSIIDKSGPLVGWAVKETCNYIQREFEGEMRTAVTIYPEDVVAVIDKARKEATRIKKEAADRGTMIHAAIQEWAEIVVKGGGSFIHFDDEPMQNAWEAFQEFAQTHELRPMRAEMKVIHPKRLYGGTIDLVASIRPPGEAKKRLFIVDIKSSNHFLEIPHGPQVAAYSACLNNAEYEGIGILRLDKETGIPHFHDLTEKRALHLKVFNEAHGLWLAVRAVKQGGKK